MEKHYHAHLIRFGGSLDANSQQWTPTLEVLWSEGGDTVSKRLLFKTKFSTQTDAEVRAFDFAVTWIDCGKPEIVSS
jgi:hypothetical protein